MLYQVKYPNLWFMYSWHFMTIFQYYGLNIFFYQTDQQIWPFFNVTGRRMEATSRNSLARNSTPNRAFGMVAIPWDNNEVLEGVKSWNLWYTSFLDDHGYLSLIMGIYLWLPHLSHDHGTLKEHHLFSWGICSLPRLKKSEGGGRNLMWLWIVTILSWSFNMFKPSNVWG